MGATFSPALLASLWDSLPATASLFKNQNEDEQSSQNGQPQSPSAGTPPAQQAPAAPKLDSDGVPSAAANQIPSEDRYTGPGATPQGTLPPQQPQPASDPSQHTGFWNYLLHGPGSDPNSKGWTLSTPDSNTPGTDWGRVGRYVWNDIKQGPDYAGSQDRPSAGFPQDLPGFATGSGEDSFASSSSQGAPPSATTSLFNQSTPVVQQPQPTSAPAAPDIQSPAAAPNDAVSNLLGAPATTPNITPQGAIDYGKSQNNLDLESGKNAPIPGRPFVPGSRDINPATNKPFTTQEWNAFAKPSDGAPFGRRPDDGRPFVDADEQQQYAKNNGIDLNSFANNHHTLQNVLGLLLSGVADAQNRMTYWRGEGFPMEQSPTLQMFLKPQLEAQQYDLNRPAIQTQANLEMAKTKAGIEQQQATTAAAEATASKTQAQADELRQFGVGTTNPITGEMLQGPELLGNLKATNPGLFQTLVDLHNGDQSIEKLVSTRSGSSGPSRAQWISLLERAYPDQPYNEGLFNNKQSLIKDFSGSGASTGGGMIASANTAIHHVSQIWQAYQALGNQNPQVVNNALNFVRTQLGMPQASNVDTARTALATELARTFQGGVPTESENKDWQNSFGTGQSPEQFRQGVQVILRMMQERVAAQNDRWKSVFGSDYNGVPNTPGANTYQAGLTADSRNILSNMNALEGGGNQSQGGQGSVVMVGADGKKWNVPADKVDLFKKNGYKAAQ